jgi:DNA primase
VDIYLKARGLELPPNPDAVLRWHPECQFGRDKLPCMVALFRDALTDAPTAIHRTYIYAPAHGKAERMALGRIAGGAIKLWQLDGSGTLAVGEGIETVLAAVKLGVATAPAWATTVANNLSRLPVVAGVKRLTILSDNDESNAGQQAATKLYHSYNHAGCDAVIKQPRTVGTDFNDLLRSELRR